MNRRIDAVALNPQPLPPHEAVVGAQLLENVLVSAIIVVGGRGAGEGAGVLRAEIDDWCGTGWPGKWPKPKPRRAGTRAWSSPGRPAAAAWPSSTTTPRVQEALGAAAEQLRRGQPAGADATGRRVPARPPQGRCETPSSGPAPGPTIERWSRAPSPRCCTSTGTSCAPPPPTGRRRRTGTRSGRSVPLPARGCCPSCSACCSPAPGWAATTSTPWRGWSCSPSGAAPASSSTGCRPTCATTSPGPSSTARSAACCGPASTSGTVASRRRAPEPSPDPDHHQRWFEQRAIPGDVG